KILLKCCNAAALRRNHVKHGLQCGALPCPVLSNQAHDSVGRQRKAHMVQCKPRVALTKSLDAQHGFHYSFSFSSGNSSRSRAVLIICIIRIKISSCISAIPGGSWASSPNTTNRSPGLILKTSLASLGSTLWPSSPTL